MKLLLVCSCRKLFERFLKLVGIENSDFFGIISSFRLSILFVSLCTVGDGIDALLFVRYIVFVWFGLGFFNLIILHFARKIFFPGILLFKLIVSYRSDSKFEFEYLCDFWDIVFIGVTLSFTISLLILLLPNESKFCSCDDFL